MVLGLRLLGEEILFRLIDWFGVIAEEFRILEFFLCFGGF